MDIENINQVLAQLEKSLTELDSAREQVQTVTKSSNNLTSATSDLAKEVKQIADKIKDETTNVISVFSQKLIEFEMKLNTTSKAGQKSIMDEVGKFRESSNELKTTATNTIIELNAISTKTLEEKDVEITKTIESINTYCQKVQSLIDALSEMDLPNRMDELNTNISKIISFIEDSQKRVETNLTEKLEKLKKSQISALLSFEEKTNQNITSFENKIILLAKKQQINSFITWCLIIIGIILLAIR